MAKPRQMKLGMFLFGLGHHAQAWRLEGTDPTRLYDPDFYIGLAKTAEAAKFDMVFLADNVGLLGNSPKGLSRSQPVYFWEPLTMLAAMATHTNRIGLVSTVSTTYMPPYHLARKMASLDHLSRGRAGWNLVTSGSDSEAANFGLDHQVSHSERYARAREYVDVARALWDSWGDDPLVLDQAGGRFFDPDQLEPINHVGPFFSVRGPLQSGRPIQGHPVVVQAGASEDGQALAAETAEVVFTAQQTLEGALAFAQGLKDRVVAAGRDRDSLLVMPGVSIYVAETREAARAKLDALDAFVDTEMAIRGFKTFLDWDLSGVDLDGPPPRPQATEGWQSRQQLFYDLAVKQGLSLRQMMALNSAARGHWVLVGTPEDIVDDLQAWFEAGAADGFNIMPPSFPNELDEFVRLVLPELRRRGLFRQAYEGATFPDHLGLKRPPATLPRPQAAVLDPEKVA